MNALRLTIVVAVVVCVGLLSSERCSFAQVASGETPAAPDIQGAQNEDESNIDEVAEKSKSFWMEQKLRLSKELLVGLANADFESILRSAEIMRGLNRVEVFVRRKPEGYRDQLRFFNMANRSLRKAAQEENLEAATLAFNQMTISCVNCHKHLRDAK